MLVLVEAWSTYIAHCINESFDVCCWYVVSHMECDDDSVCYADLNKPDVPSKGINLKEVHTGSR